MIWGMIGNENGFNVIDVDSGDIVVSGVSEDAAEKIIEAHNKEIDEFIVKLKAYA